MTAETGFAALRGHFIGEELRVNAGSDPSLRALGFRFDQASQALIALLAKEQGAMFLGTEVPEGEPSKDGQLLAAQ